MSVHAPTRGEANARYHLHFETPRRSTALTRKGENRGNSVLYRSDDLLPDIIKTEGSGGHMFTAVFLYA